MQIVLAALIFLGGFFLPVQIAVNSRLSGGLSSPVRSSVISFLVGLIALVAVMLAADQRISTLAGVNRAPSWAGALSLPWWAYLGGFCGAFYVLMAIIVLPRLGAVATIALALLGQQCASIAIDTFGLFGTPRLPLTWARIFGTALVLAGAILVQAKK